MNDTPTPNINSLMPEPMEQPTPEVFMPEPKKSHTGLWMFILLILVLGGLGYVTFQKPELVLPTVFVATRMSILFVA